MENSSYLCSRKKDNPLILTIMKINDVIYKAEYVMSTVRGLRDEPQNVGPEDLLETLLDLDEVSQYLRETLQDLYEVHQYLCDYSEQYLRDGFDM